MACVGANEKTSFAPTPAITILEFILSYCVFNERKKIEKSLKNTILEGIVEKLAEPWHFYQKKWGTVTIKLISSNM